MAILWFKRTWRQSGSFALQAIRLAPEDARSPYDREVATRRTDFLRSRLTLPLGTTTE
jgi:hypothetical protein